MNSDLRSWEDLGPLNDAYSRRRCRERLNDSQTMMFLLRAGLGAGLRCAEVGAGTGSVAALMSSIVGESGGVLATEIRGSLVSELRRTLPDNVEVTRHDCRGELPVGEYDIIHARFVLEHLESRDHVLQSLMSSLRCGGRLIIEDAYFSSPDFGGHSEIGSAIKEFEAQLADGGTDYQWARQLPECAGGAALAAVDYPVFAGSSEWAWFWASTLESVLGDGVILQAAQHALRDRRRWFQGPAVVRCIFEKPGEAL
ncbi:methyltransferase domain-containing protein [Cutibacterium avidum]|uniref:class I SAM-dependent methyltransferase n=1 Tax=Cutibacterium avidum TaxID=33010 RepID=UPI002092D579|nr:methyltransferase domain-containing protein [Cutibacterium avidum]